MSHFDPLTSERGSTLIVVSIMLTVVLVAGVAMLSISGRDLNEASAATRQQTLRACAKSAREVFISNLRYSSSLPTAFSMSVIDPVTSEVMLDLAKGHDPSLVTAVIADIVFIDDASLGKGRTGVAGARVTNDILPAGMAGGGSGARVMARCRDNVGRTVEVEFMIRYGI